VVHIVDVCQLWRVKAGTSFLEQVILDNVQKITAHINKVVFSNFDT